MKCANYYALDFERSKVSAHPDKISAVLTCRDDELCFIFANPWDGSDATDKVVFFGKPKEIDVQAATVVPVVSEQAGRDLISGLAVLADIIGKTLKPSLVESIGDQ